MQAPIYTKKHYLITKPEVNNVLYSPKFKFNLTSVSKFTDENKMFHYLLSSHLYILGPMYWESDGDW